MIVEVVLIFTLINTFLILCIVASILGVITSHNNA